MYHNPPITEQHPPSYDDIQPLIPSIIITPANVQDDEIPPPIPAKTNETSNATKQISTDKENTGEQTSSLTSTSEQTGCHDEKGTVQRTSFYETTV